MPAAEQKIARKVHEIVTRAAPQLTAKTWYVMPAYADDNGKVVVYFQGASKFDARYLTIGFDEAARLGRLTDWVEVGGGIVRGAGLKTFLAGGDARTLFELTSVSFSVPADMASEATV